MMFMFIYVDVYDDFDLITTFQYSELDWIGFEWERQMKWEASIWNQEGTSVAIGWIYSG